MKNWLILILVIMAIPASVLGASADFQDQPSSEDKATFDQILVPVMKIYNFVKYAASIVAGLILLFAGINYMISGNDPRKRETAKNMAMYVVIGLIVIWAAPMVVNFIVG